MTHPNLLCPAEGCGKPMKYLTVEGDGNPTTTTGAAGSSKMLPAGGRQYNLRGLRGRPLLEARA